MSSPPLPCPLLLRIEKRGFLRFRCRALFEGARIFLSILALLLLTSAAFAKDKKHRAPADTKSARTGEEIFFQGMCDASAAVALGTNLVVVASDEENSLRVYRRDHGGLPVRQLDLTSHLGLERHSPETDIEGAAPVGDLVYWITSHSRNSDAQFRPNRHRFFATRLHVSGEQVQMEFAGQPCHRLADDLARAPSLQRFNFGLAARLSPKKAGGLNIEGLCATPEGHLLIAFRNPVPNKRALLVPLLNPREVLAGQPAQFGEAILLDLDGLGVRDLAYAQGRYAIVAGSTDGDGPSKLFSWTGGNAKPHPYKHVKLKSLNPEAVVIYPDKGFEEFQLFSDDSSLKSGGRRCADLRDAMARRFRGVWIGSEAGADE